MSNPNGARPTFPRTHKATTSEAVRSGLVRAYRAVVGSRRTHSIRSRLPAPAPVEVNETILLDLWWWGIARREVFTIDTGLVRARRRVRVEDCGRHAEGPVNCNSLPMRLMDAKQL